MMEEVWKDMGLSNLPPKSPSPAALSLHHTAAASAVFHDFLAGNFRGAHHPHSPDPLAGNPFLPLRKRCANSDEDRRWNKIIKNRESAVRSRARKQAYTNELEMEIAHLVLENTALKREQEELKMAIAAQASSRGKLQRALSSPI